MHQVPTEPLSPTNWLAYSAKKMGKKITDKYRIKTTSQPFDLLPTATKRKKWLQQLPLYNVAFPPDTTGFFQRGNKRAVVKENKSSTCLRISEETTPSRSAIVSQRLWGQVVLCVLSSMLLHNRGATPQEASMENSG
jgi:hypothetical protein